MKVFISVDMEGVAGIVDWAQCLATGDDYALGRDLLVGEVNAAIGGAVAAGATEILVNDAHSFMRNLPPDLIGGEASYLSGRFKPLYMMQGLDASFDAVVFLGYHAAIATPGVLSHTYNPRAIADVRLCGTTTGEAGLNALVAQHFRVPVAVITGDQYVGPEAAPFCPGIKHLQVKESISRYSALNMHPRKARDLIREGVRAALCDLAPPPAIASPATIEIRFTSPDMAEQATWVRGVSRLDSLTVSLTDDEPLRLYQAFITLVYLTRSLIDTY
ncbi:D-aminopeptidase DppA [Rhizocola hellebori]|uniref:D-aminopeptidase DppA n=1 Tax=Rhizocola hellebori TaxID=1392758 RepID=A0A8J3VL78_9ACTN|nr:M55 family metallopeptidase [Rhizocola hellebori]GIH09731.1 D-aminopeptidase DppA [Rhizocola hellebori]